MTTKTKTPAAQIVADAIAATQSAAVTVTRRRRGKLAEMLESAARALIDEHGLPAQWPKALLTDARTWRKQTAPTRHDAGASLKFVTRDSGSTKLQHNNNTELATEYRQAITYLDAGNRDAHGAECPWATPGCIALCLGHGAGQLGLSAGQKAVRARSRMLREDTRRFLVALAGDLMTTASAYEKEAASAVRVYRFSGTSEFALESMPAVSTILHNSGGWVLMDYAKRPGVSGWTPIPGTDVPYYVAPSASERHSSPETLANGAVVAVDVLRDEELPTMWHGRHVVDADRHDLRLADTPADRDNFVRLLRAKGRAADLVKQHRAALARGEALITWDTFLKPIDEDAR